MTVRRVMGAALAALIVSSSFAIGAGARFAYALFGDSEMVLGTFSTAASFSGTAYYLHNNPTPPVGDTAMQANLPLSTTTPTASTLFNYDTDRDAFAGRLVLRGATGDGETDLTKYQNWRTAALVSPITITTGTATFDFWSAMRGFGTAKRGVVTAFLRDFNPVTSTYIPIASATLDMADWQGGSATWVHKTLGIGVPLYVLVAGHRLELKVVVASTSADDVWFAYDTTSHGSFLRLP